uniref:Uncharacterized protein n=1 Tax=Amphimedon queenslandica TaxID=400682 RepID=A0A1X7VVU4_AMPQE
YIHFPHTCSLYACTTITYYVHIIPLHITHTNTHYKHNNYVHCIK